MFDLEEQVRLWRRRLVVGGAVQPQALDELVSHARDQIDALVTAGLTNEEAWIVTRRRLGDPSALESEFAKLDRPWLRQLFWVAVGWLSLLTSSALSGAFSDRLPAVMQSAPIGVVRIAVGLADVCMVPLALLAAFVMCGWAREARVAPLVASVAATVALSVRAAYSGSAFHPLQSEADLARLNAIVSVHWHTMTAMSVIMCLLAGGTLAALMRRFSSGSAR